MPFKAHLDFAIAGNEITVGFEQRDRLAGQLGAVVLEINDAASQVTLGLLEHLNRGQRRRVYDCSTFTEAAVTPIPHETGGLGAAATAAAAIHRGIATQHLVIGRRTITGRHFLLGRGTGGNKQGKHACQYPGLANIVGFHLYFYSVSVQLFTFERPPNRLANIAGLVG